MVIPMMTIYVKNGKNHKQGHFVKIRHFISVILPQNFLKWQIRSKNEKYKNSQNLAYSNVDHRQSVKYPVRNALNIAFNMFLEY